MNINELSRYGFPQPILDIWRAAESEELLPVQEVAIGQGLLDGHSMLIAAPTSSGKTFLSEIAAYRKAQERQKVIYIAPHKAIVEEKYYDFSQKYTDYGIRVVASSGDHYEFDQDIQLGRFDIAVFTYEKLAMLLVVSPTIASSCGLLIVDEIQMLSDPNRGADLELLLTKFLTLSRDTQILALSASIDNFADLDQWLRAKGLLVTERPIELREGVYTPDGLFKFREWNTRRQGEEHFGASPSDDLDAMLDTVAAHLLNAGEQILIFRMDKPKTVATARRIAGWANLNPVTRAIDAMQTLENTTAREQLIECLRNGVAFHNADLTSEERLLIESNFREGHIRVICSTSTLAMGVNLPAKTVIIADAEKWDRDEKTDEYKNAPLTVAEYRNMSGRAGRYRFRDEFGRSVLLASKPFLYDQYRANYIGGTVRTVSSSLGKRPIVQQVLDIIVSRLGEDEAEIVAFMMQTFAGFRTWTTQEAKDAISMMIRESIQKCIELDLVQHTQSHKLAATDLGRVCASKKISLDTFVLLRDWLSGALPASGFAAFYFAVNTAELSRISFNMSTNEFRSNAYIQYLRQNHEAFDVPQEILESIAVSNQEQLGYEPTRRLKMILVAKAMIEGVQYRDIEKSFQVKAGTIKNLCEHLAWIVDSSSALAPLFGRTRKEAESLSILAERLRYGVPSAALAIARLRAPGMNRTHLMQLLENGYDTVDKILDADLASFQGVISRKLAINLQERIQQSIRDSLERRKRDQMVRLQRIGVDTTVLVALYEQTGTALEITLCDLFTPPFCNLVFERVTKQREGEPDNLLHLPDGGIIAFSVTAKENQNVSMKKAGEIIASAARYKPVARVVVGRPDFHELSIKNADEIVADGVNFKLLPIPVLAEMYVRLSEGRLTSDDVVTILRDKTGYITYNAL
ncbi:MAG: DEAD/DEAH box helicase [Anaerolineales bacterium]|nr:DEAD/DEAH box helicase [Anaerolineales bacterium]